MVTFNLFFEKLVTFNRYWVLCVVGLMIEIDFLENNFAHSPFCIVLLHISILNIWTRSNDQCHQSQPHFVIIKNKTLPKRKTLQLLQFFLGFFTALIHIPQTQSVPTPPQLCRYYFDPRPFRFCSLPMLTDTLDLV